jgi:hypothetical protein
MAIGTIQMMKTFRSGPLWAARIGQIKLHLHLILAGFCSAAFLFAPAVAKADTVTTTADSGPGSLRNTVLNAAANATITFDYSLSGQTILLTSGQILLNRNVTIDASGLPNGISIDGNHVSRIFYVNGYGLSLVLNSLTITNGYSSDYGGGILDFGGGPLTLNNCKLVNNQSGANPGGGALYHANGSVNGGKLIMNTTTVSGNMSSNVSAIYIDSTQTTISNCTFSANSGGTGSALQIGHAAMSVFNSTFSGNVSGTGPGAAISVVGNPDTNLASLVNCTVVSNWVVSTGQPGALYIQPTYAAMSLNNTIVSGNTSGGVASDIGGNVTSGSAFNLIGVGGGVVNGVNHNLVGITNPLVAALGNYGGPTQTMPPLAGSPAIDAGGNVSLTTDQRGLPRLSGSAVDIGAVEIQPVVTTTADSGPGSLRDTVAIVHSNSFITFATNLSGQTITLTSGPLVLSNINVTIDASALTNGVAINGNANSRLFQVNSGASVALNALTLTNGKAQGGSGGAIVNLGTLAVNNCTLAGNTGASGGAISNNAVCTLQNSTLYGNSASAGNGGAIANAAGSTLNLLQCTVSGNSSTGNGGGIDNHLGQVNVTNTIIAGNSGGDINNGSGSTLTCGGSNIVQVLTSSGTVLGANTILAVNPLLGPLANNGGPTLTLLPQSGSPAIDAGVSSAASSLTNDQRGLPRLSGSAVDIGAVESQLPSVVTLSASGVTATSATLNGTVNPNRSAATAYFQYGLTTNYGSFSATTSLPPTNATFSLSELISGLVPGALYHYRLVASNALGTVQGVDTAFAAIAFAPISPHVFTGAEPGQGLDLQGSFLYAVNVGSNGAPGLIGDANFTADNVPGVTITTPGGVLNTINNWASPNFGATTDGLRLTQVMSSIRWTATPGILTVNLTGLQVGADYRLQLLFIESGYDRTFNVNVNGTTIVPDFRMLDYGPSGTPVVVPYVFTSASTNALIQLGDGTVANGYNPLLCGFTLETLTNVASVVTLSASDVTTNGATLNGTVNPNGAATAAYFQYGLTTNYGSFTVTNILPATNVTLSVSNVLSGLTPGTTYYYQLVGNNSDATVFGAQSSFTTVTTTTVTTLPASSITATNAILNGTVNPNGAATTAYFQYGLTPSYGSFSPTNILPATNVALSVSNLLSGLTPGTTYYYQLVGSNSAGTVFGAQSSFTTLTVPIPTVTTLPANSTTPTSAILNGTVNPNGAATTAYFQYGLTTNYGSFTAATNLPGTNTTLSVSNLISGLVPDTVYHFRLVASNAFSTVLGLDQSIGLISPRVFTGAEPGQGLDLQGSFLYAVNLSGNPGVGLIGDANFTADNVSGMTLTTPGGGPNTLNNWANPNFGTTTNGLRLTQVMSAIRWTTGILIVNLSGLQVGATYQLQLLFIETYDDRAFNVLVNGTTIVPNFRLLDYGPMGTPIVIPYVFTAASTNALIQLGGGTGGTDNSPQMSGFTLETLASVTAPNFISPLKVGNGTFQLSFTNLTGASFRVFAATNIAQPTAAWSLLGPATESPAGSGQFQFTDPQATNYQQRFYRVTSP